MKIIPVNALMPQSSNEKTEAFYDNTRQISDHETTRIHFTHWGTEKSMNEN